MFSLFGSHLPEHVFIIFRQDPRQFKYYQGSLTKKNNICTIFKQAIIRSPFSLDVYTFLKTHRRPVVFILLIVKQYLSSVGRIESYSSSLFQRRLYFSFHKIKKPFTSVPPIPSSLVVFQSSSQPPPKRSHNYRTLTPLAMYTNKAQVSNSSSPRHISCASQQALSRRRSHSQSHPPLRLHHERCRRRMGRRGHRPV